MISYILLKWSERVLWKESEWKRSIGHTQIWIGVMWVRGFKEGVRKPVVGSTFAFRQNVLSLLPRGFMRWHTMFAAQQTQYPCAADFCLFPHFCYSEHSTNKNKCSCSPCRYLNGRLRKRRKDLLNEIKQTDISTFKNTMEGGGEMLGADCCFKDYHKWQMKQELAYTNPLERSAQGWMRGPSGIQRRKNASVAVWHKMGKMGCRMVAARKGKKRQK